MPPGVPRIPIAPLSDVISRLGVHAVAVVPLVARLAVPCHVYDISDDNFDNDSLDYVFTSSATTRL